MEFCQCNVSQFQEGAVPSNLEGEEVNKLKWIQIIKCQTNVHVCSCAFPWKGLVIQSVSEKC